MVEPGREWCAEVDALMHKACLHASPGEMRAQWEAGAALFLVKRGGTMIGAYLLRVDGDEGVILAGAGDGGGIDLVGVVVPIMEQQFVGVRSIRVHTSRPGMLRRLVAQGYEAREMVLAKVVKNDV